MPNYKHNIQNQNYTKSSKLLWKNQLWNPRGTFKQRYGNLLFYNKKIILLQKTWERYRSLEEI